MKEVVITSIRSADEVDSISTNLWEIKFTVSQKTPINYLLEGHLEWKGDPIISEIQELIEKLTQDVKMRKIKRTK